MKRKKEIDWSGLAKKLGTISQSGSVTSESGGTRVACNALIDLIGDAALRDAVDYQVSGQPGHEIARSVLWLLHPPAAMDRCREIFRDSPDEQEAGDAINLLQVVADRRVLEWVPEFLASPNALARTWSMGVVDQLLWDGEIEMDEAQPLIDVALRDPSEMVRNRAQQAIDINNDAAEANGMNVEASE